MTTTEHVTIDTDTLAQRIDALGASGGTSELVSIAHMLTTELRVRQHRLDSLWRLIGRCDMAFELIAAAKLLGPVKKIAEQLGAEIKKASGA